MGLKKNGGEWLLEKAGGDRSLSSGDTCKLLIEHKTEEFKFSQQINYRVISCNGK